MLFNKKGSHENLLRLLTRFQPSWLSEQHCGFPLMAALVLVLVMVVVMDMLVHMLLSSMFVFVTIMSMSLFLVLMFVYMLIFCMATHFPSPPLYFNIISPKN
jgi:hypothetical protein